LCASALQVRAWEYEMQGSFNWTHEWYNQRGSKGFFGPYNVDNSGGATRVANLNFWNGGQFDTNITTSADAGWSYFNVEFKPVIKINEALRMSGKYRLGTYGQPLASDYHTQDAPGTSRAFSEGQWTMFWVTASTPWGILGIGKRPWTFGTGLQYDGEDAATTESISLVAPYGPFDIGIAFYPYRFAGSSSLDATYGYGDPYDLGGNQYFSRADRSGTFSKDFLAFVVYHSGPMRAGILGSYGSYHIGPEARLQQPEDVNQNLALDSELFHGSAYVKFNNGRFFFNAEAAWLYWTDRWSGNEVFADPDNLYPNPRYIEQWRYMAELGVFSGPAKLTLLYAWTPGPDRRNRGDGTLALMGKQAAAFVRHNTFDTHLGNFDVFRPYSYLFSYDYGAGLGAYNLSGDGYLRDASVVAARLNYAVAANLNVFGSMFYANRTAHGYSWGCLGPNSGGGNFPNAADGNVDINLNRYNTSPNIPDTALGYEVDLGFDWKLLEHWTLGIVAGYWQPGKWFSYACIDRSVVNWHAGTAANNYGTRPDRSIDPIIGGSFNLTFDF
jgi:hypothetical protein